MAGLVPAIPFGDAARCQPKRDARHDAGHDGVRERTAAGGRTVQTYQGRSPGPRRSKLPPQGSAGARGQAGHGRVRGRRPRHAREDRALEGVAAGQGSRRGRSGEERSARGEARAEAEGRTEKHGEGYPGERRQTGGEGEEEVAHARGRNGTCMKCDTLIEDLTQST